MSSANKTQVGGTHYRTAADIQHWDLVYLIFGGDYLLGNASKYMARIGKKGGPEKAVEDIDKAIHYLQKKREHLVAELEAQAAEPNAGYVKQD